MNRYLQKTILSEDVLPVYNIPKYVLIYDINILL